MAAEITVNLNPVADKRAAWGERIIEITGPNGEGFLLSLRVAVSGIRAEAYRVDDGVTFVVPADKIERLFDGV